MLIVFVRKDMAFACVLERALDKCPARTAGCVMTNTGTPPEGRLAEESHLIHHRLEQDSHDCAQQLYSILVIFVEQ